MFTPIHEDILSSNKVYVIAIIMGFSIRFPFKNRSFTNVVWQHLYKVLFLIKSNHCERLSDAIYKDFTDSIYLSIIYLNYVIYPVMRFKVRNLCIFFF